MVSSKRLPWQWRNPSEESLPVSYCLDSSLHGLKYVGQPDRHIFERIFWIVAVILTLIASAVSITLLYNDYRENPIITVFNPVQQKLDNIPFPAITLCNLNPLPKSELTAQALKIAGNVATDVLRITDREKLRKNAAIFVDMLQVCDSSPSFVEKITDTSAARDFMKTIRDKIVNDLDKVQQYMNPTRTLRKFAQSCNEMILHCIWKGQVANCSEMFTDVETDYGHCCTFNSIPRSLLTGIKNEEEPLDASWRDLTYDNLLFTEETKKRRYPERQRYPGRSGGLSFLLDPNLDEYVCPNVAGQGFMMGVNVPLDLPRLRDSGVVLRSNAEVFVGIKPEITMADETVNKFSLKRRQCYQDHEYKLEHYTKYTVSNCMNECIAKRIFKECNCLRFYMPGGVGEKLCKMDKYNCTVKVEADILENGLTSACKECLPTCTEILYHHELSSISLDQEQMYKLFTHASPGPFRRPVKDPTLVHVFMDSNSVFSKLRKETTSRTQLLSNAGGLLGLCMGFSVLSFLEIFYYGTIRLFFTFLRKKNEKSFREAPDGNITEEHLIQHGIHGPFGQNIFNHSRSKQSPCDSMWTHKRNQKVFMKSEVPLLPYYYRTMEANFGNTGWQ